MADVIGYATSMEQMESVREQCRRLARPSSERLRRNVWPDRDPRIVAAVCPHDDYYYAGRHYELTLSWIKSRCVLLVGVFHAARIFECRDRLVFDAFRAWSGPRGEISVSEIRDEFCDALPNHARVIDNDMHTVEHSLEGIAGYLQALKPDLEIVPILVPYMSWARLAELTEIAADALGPVFESHGVELGNDVTIVCSSDAVHYGDSGFDYAPYGTDAIAYQRAVEVDRQIAEQQLSGPLVPEKLRDFYDSCVDPDDPARYRVTWCGRFAIPFGLGLAARLLQTETRCLVGRLLDYSTSVSEESLDAAALQGLGPTAPNNFHHFVGYASLTYERGPRLG